MSLARYEKQVALLELYKKLSIAEKQSELEEERINHNEMMKRLRNKLNE